MKTKDMDKSVLVFGLSSLDIDSYIHLKLLISNLRRRLRVLPMIGDL